MTTTITLRAATKLGMPVYQILRNGVLIHQFMCLPMAKTRFIQLTRRPH